MRKGALGGAPGEGGRSVITVTRTRADHGATGPGAGPPPILELDRVSVRFGGVTALDDLSLSVENAAIQGLIGPNGSGKSTAFNVITGLQRPASGDIRFKGRSLLGLRPHRIAALGVGRTFQHLRIFGALSVLENVMTGTHLRGTPPGSLATLFGLPGFHAHERAMRAHCMEVLEQLGIADQADQVAGRLPYGMQKRVDLARTLVAEPELLLLDEPAAGLNEADSRRLLEIIAELQARAGMAILVVEHNMHFIGSLCPFVTVIDFGRRIAEGSPAEVRDDDAVVAAYLGDDTTPVATDPPPASEAGTPALAVSGIEVRYGNVAAVRDAELTVASGALTAIVGANGAGKTTLLSAIAGLVPVRRGRIAFAGTDITAMPCEKRVAAGIVLCPEGRRLFPDLTVRENLLMGAFSGRDAERKRAAIARVYELFPRVKERDRQPAGTLSGGEQQMVAIGRALMGEPRLLLLDEPSLGLAPNLVQLIFEIIAEIRRQGTTIVLVEQNARMALAIADHGYVMETGRVTMGGAAADLLAHSDVIDAYLGEGGGR